MFLATFVIAYLLSLVTTNDIPATELDLEELKQVQYGLEIQTTPVVENLLVAVISLQSIYVILALNFEMEEKDNNDDNPAFTIKSKYGQLYYCTIPKWKEEIQTQKATSNTTNITELLRPLENTCMTKSKGWWTYKFCYNDRIEQYHIQDDEITGDIISLGSFESEKDWSKEDETLHELQRYHSQMYTNGSVCDSTNKARQTQIKLYCEEDSENYIGRISEPTECVYVINIFTPLLCQHPSLRPKAAVKPRPISCSPVLNAVEYSNYQQMIKETVPSKNNDMANNNKHLNSVQQYKQIVKDIVAAKAKTNDAANRSGIKKGTFKQCTARERPNEGNSVQRYWQIVNDIVNSGKSTQTITTEDKLSYRLANGNKPSATSKSSTIIKQLGEEKWSDKHDNLIQNAALDRSSKLISKKSGSDRYLELYMKMIYIEELKYLLRKYRTILMKYHEAEKIDEITPTETKKDVLESNDEHQQDGANKNIDLKRSKLSSNFQLNAIDRMTHILKVISSKLKLKLSRIIEAPKKNTVPDQQDEIDRNANEESIGTSSKTDKRSNEIVKFVKSVLKGMKINPADVEVRIITVNNDDMGDDKTLTNKEKQNLENAIKTLFGSKEQLQQEEIRQRKLQEGYNFKWPINKEAH
ncbi:uncharacterized protein TRIADDRAFT_60534 [Trichoplax adhaerens]|uniref:MRH domain-containing protein n=1 Tax=Trichoplax adhaerens TaxID=10228 RepID=B3S8G7_TRIAD|nr:hypothetical protein TRIADDRAFT_60534 [Trichoplax adhaerens]EDV20948.1 hypothetical protein TRIADDRAFT_60534 [Trichoplax adhaerens]|eukprot:XP_002116592.1 hypothetical protein TRIADDRAFT_60534 [Trichoplax adhaerens]